MMNKYLVEIDDTTIATVNAEWVEGEEEAIRFYIHDESRNCNIRLVAMFNKFDHFIEVNGDE